MRLAVDHIVPIKKDWSRRFDVSNFQILCAVDCNLAKGSHDQTNWKAASEPGKEQHADVR